MAIGTKFNLSQGTTGPLLNRKAGLGWHLRTALVATTGYVASSHMPCDSQNSVLVVATAVGVAPTSVQIMGEGSVDGTNWFAVRSTGGYGESVTMANLVSATDVAIGYKFDVSHGVRYFRVRIKETGGAQQGTWAIDGYEGGLGAA